VRSSAVGTMPAAFLIEGALILLLLVVYSIADDTR
jgi:hypothetical protein